MGPKRRGRGGGGGQEAGTRGEEAAFGGGRDGERPDGGRGGRGGGQHRGQRRNRRGGGGPQQQDRGPAEDDRFCAGGPEGGRGGRRGNDQRQQPPPDAPRPGRQRLVSECGDDHCPVCLSRISIFAVGMCNHHVCAECSTRMRVLCQQNECPICRQDLPKVFFSTVRRSFAEVEHEPYRRQQRFRVFFENSAVETEFWRLLDHRCPVCGEDERPFRTFKELARHVRDQHELHYCDLCVEHLKIFTHERRCYSRSDLATHKRKGDPDDTSHRGHPNCEFCQTRFMDKDDLYRHLRRDHFFCHFCDADGLQHFYPDYEELRKHFESDHFLCDEGDCINEQFTHAFRSEIDLKAHRAERHSTNFQSKAAARQNRVVELELNFSRPTAAGQTSRRRGRGGGEGAAAGGGPMPSTNLQIVDQIDGVVGGRNGDAPDRPAPDMSAESFPTLGGSAALTSIAPEDSLARRLTGSSGYASNWSDGRRMPREEDFPSLPGAPPTSAAPRHQMVNGAKKKQQPQPQQNKAKTREEEFPTLGGPTGGIAAFRPSGSSLHRDIPGRPQSWTAAASNAVAGNVVGAVVPGEKPKSRNGASNMVTLKKQPKQPAPAPEIPAEDDFPDLSGPAKPMKELEKPKDKKKQSKKKSASLAKKDELLSSSGLKGDANLKSAADLILLDKGGKSDKSKSTNNNDEDWKEVPSSSPSTKKKATSGAGSVPPGFTSALNALSINGSDPPVGASFAASLPSPAPASKAGPPPGLSARAGTENRNPDFPALGANIQPHPPKAEWGLTQKSPPPGGPAVKTAEKKKPVEEDFPSLGGASKKMSANFRPVQLNTGGKSTASWGNSASEQVQPAKSAPQRNASTNSNAVPPGFSGVKMGRRSNVPYRQPANFAARNKSLLSSVTSVMGGKSLEFARFKELSGQFRLGKLSCRQFYEESLSLVEDDRKAFMKFFPELLILLPDIDKQQELFNVHMTASRNSSASSDSLSLPTLVCSCPECGQIVGRADASEHAASHAKDQDFPMLG